MDLLQIALIEFLVFSPILFNAVTFVRACTWRSTSLSIFKEGSVVWASEPEALDR